MIYYIVCSIIALCAIFMAFSSDSFVGAGLCLFVGVITLFLTTGLFFLSSFIIYRPIKTNCVANIKNEKISREGVSYYLSVSMDEKHFIKQLPLSTTFIEGQDKKLTWVSSQRKNNGYFVPDVLFPDSCEESDFVVTFPNISEIK